MKKNGKVHKVEGKKRNGKKVINREIRAMLTAGKDEEKIVATVVKVYKEMGKDEAWALKRAKSKLAYVKRHFKS